MLQTVLELLFLQESVVLNVVRSCNNKLLQLHNYSDVIMQFVYLEGKSSLLVNRFKQTATLGNAMCMLVSLACLIVYINAIPCSTCTSNGFSFCTQRACPSVDPRFMRQGKRGGYSSYTDTQLSFIIMNVHRELFYPGSGVHHMWYGMSPDMQ